jgi:hypothetical protein
MEQLLLTLLHVLPFFKARNSFLVIDQYFFSLNIFRININSKTVNGSTACRQNHYHLLHCFIPLATIEKRAATIDPYSLLFFHRCG